MDNPAPYAPRIPYKAIESLALAIAILAPMLIWNRYVFAESNLPVVLVLLILAAFLSGPGKIPRDLDLPGVAISFFLFVVYAWARRDDGWDFTIAESRLDGIRPGLAYIVDTIIYYLSFVVSAVLFYNRGRFSLTLWFLTCGYIVAFIVRNSFDLSALEQGFNLSAGFVLVSLLPFVFLLHANTNKMPLIPSALLFLCIMWLALIGARTAVGTLLGFYIAMWAWPLITRNRFTYFSAFWGMIILIGCLTTLYLVYAINNPANPLAQESLVEGSSVGILQKRIGTRSDIWIHLSFLISQQPVFGYGADHATTDASPLWFIPFSLHRDNLSAHSVYFELLYRLGGLGLLGFILIMFNIWRVFWRGRDQWAVRVAGAFLLSVLFFCSTGTYLLFNDLQLRSGFGWIILGIGAGACLRARKDTRRKSVNDCKPSFGANALQSGAAQAYDGDSSNE